MPWAEHAWEVRKCRQRVRTICLIHLAGKRRKATKVRARGRETYVRIGVMGCFCAGRRELKRKECTD